MAWLVHLIAEFPDGLSFPLTGVRPRTSVDNGGYTDHHLRLPQYVADAWPIMWVWYPYLRSTPK